MPIAALLVWSSSYANELIQQSATDSSQQLPVAASDESVAVLATHVIPAIVMYCITCVRLSVISGFESRGACAVKREAVQLFPFLDRTEEGSIFIALETIGSQAGSESEQQAMHQMFMCLRWGVVVVHAYLPIYSCLGVDCATASYQQWIFMAVCAFMSGRTFNRLLYLSGHVISSSVSSVRRLEAFCILTDPDEYYKTRKHHRQSAMRFPPFLNLRDTKDILRWNRTRDLLLRVSNSHDKQRLDVHLGVIIVATLVACIFVLLARCTSILPTDSPKYVIPLCLFDMMVFSVIITVYIRFAARARSIQQDHLKTLQQEQFALQMLMMGSRSAEVEVRAAAVHASELLQHTHAYLEQCDMLPTLLGFQVNDTFLQTVVTVLGTTLATGLSHLLSVDTVDVSIG